uniref:Class II aldolase/adducin N-terminal domain-containing protein n=1 Tax=Moniliophthora roreri TaxID=221103 RepID=A0A0W0GBX6_MONRR
MMYFPLLALLGSAVAAAPSPNLKQAATDLLDANHILHFLDVVDAFGHISVRNPDNSSQFIMSFAVAPALATSQSLVTYDISNATALHLTFNESITGSEIPSSFLERFIHSQIYAAFPNAASLGTLTPIFDIESPNVNLAQDAPHDFLIRDTELGDALAETFNEASEVVLMRGHGMALRAPSIRHAVFRAFYAKQSAVVQMQAAFLSPGLTQREVVDARATYESDSLLGRAWDLWVKQVDKEGEDLYVNDLRVTESDEDD